MMVAQHIVLCMCQAFTGQHGIRTDRGDEKQAYMSSTPLILGTRQLTCHMATGYSGAPVARHWGPD
jgi:hypothetical protein